MRSALFPSIFPSLPTSLRYVSLFLLLLLLLSPVLSSPTFPRIPWLAPILPLMPPRVNDNRSSCLSPTTPSYQLAPNPRLIQSLILSSGASSFYFWPCGVVTSNDCVSALGYHSQLCEVRTSYLPGVLNLIPFHAGDGSYDSSQFSFTTLSDGALDLHTQSGDVCATNRALRYNVTLHLRCDYQALTPTLVGLAHDTEDFCRVDGTVLSSQYCTPETPQWESPDVCHYGPHDLTPFLHAGDLSVSDGRSTSFYHPCGLVQNPLCHTLDPTAVFCSLTWNRDGSQTVSNVSLWSGAYHWSRLPLPHGGLSPTDAVVELSAPPPGCNDLSRGSRPSALAVLWTCDEAAVVPVLELPSPEDVAELFQLARPVSCKRYLRVRSMLLCTQQPGGSTAAPFVSSSSTPAGGSSISSSSSWPAISSIPALPTSSSSSTAALSSSTGAASLASIPQMWSSEYLAVAVLGVTAALCLFYCAVPLLTRFLHRTQPPPALPTAPDGTPYRAFGGGGPAGTMGGMRGEGVAKSFLDLEQYGADGRWFIAPPRQ